MSELTVPIHSFPLLTQRLLEIKSGIAERLIGDVRDQNTCSKGRALKKQMTHLVSQPEFLLTKFHTTTETLSDAEPFVVEFAREFEADAAQAGTTGGVNIDTGRQFADDRPEMACLETRSGCKRTAGSTPALSASGNWRKGEGVMNNALAMHGVAHPGDRVPGCLDGFDVARKMILYLNTQNIKDVRNDDIQEPHVESSQNYLPSRRHSV